MQAATRTSSSSDSSHPSIRHEEREHSTWTQAWNSTDAPTIAQLAQNRARALDQPWEIDFPTYYDGYTYGSEKEKQQDGSTLPSSNASGILLPTSPPPEPSGTRTQEVAFIFITCIAQFLSLSALNQTVAPVLVLAEYFNVEDYGTLSWFSASFSMSVGTFILPAGTLTPFTL